MKNDRIFNNKTFEIDEMVDQVKVISWFWSLNRLKIASCLYYEWCWNPKDCLARKLTIVDGFVCRWGMG